MIWTTKKRHFTPSHFCFWSVPCFPPFLFGKDSVWPKNLPPEKNPPELAFDYAVKLGAKNQPIPTTLTSCFQTRSLTESRSNTTAKEWSNNSKSETRGNPKGRRALGRLTPQLVELGGWVVSSPWIYPRGFWVMYILSVVGNGDFWLPSRVVVVFHS